MKSIVVAYDLQRGIGAKNDLLWLRDLPSDLAHFKDITMGGAIIMGRKTYESIGRPLPGRRNIVVSRQQLELPGVDVVDSLEAAYELTEADDVFIIGGGQVYFQAVDQADRIYATEVYEEFPQADIFFPELSADWKEVSRESHKADGKNLYDFDFVVYERA